VQPESADENNSMKLPKKIISNGAIVYRTFKTWRGLGEALFFSKLGSERFDDPNKEFGVCYLGWDFHAAFIECFRQRKRFKYVEEAEIAESSILTVKIIKTLTLLDITGSGLAKLGETAYLTSSQSYTESQMFSRTIYEHPDKVDGILYRARHDPDRFGIALYERAKHRVYGMACQSWSEKADLAEILDHYDLGLI
jgi:hypothetical protein